MTSAVAAGVLPASRPLRVVVMGVSGSGKSTVGHYMPASLRPSQLAALELPAADEHALVADIGCPPEHNVGEVHRRLTASPR